MSPPDLLLADGQENAYQDVLEGKSGQHEVMTVPAGIAEAATAPDTPFGMTDAMNFSNYGHASSAEATPSAASVEEMNPNLSAPGRSSTTSMPAVDQAADLVAPAKASLPATTPPGKHLLEGFLMDINLTLFSYILGIAVDDPRGPDWTEHSTAQRVPFLSNMLLTNHSLLETSHVVIFDKATFQMNISRYGSYNNENGVEFAGHQMKLHQAPPGFAVLPRIRHWQLSTWWTDHIEPKDADTAKLQECLRQASEWLQLSKDMTTLKLKVPCRCANKHPDYIASTIAVLAPLSRVRVKRNGQVTIVLSKSEKEGACKEEGCKSAKEEFKQLKETIESDTTPPALSRKEAMWAALKAKANYLVQLGYRRRHFPWTEISILLSTPYMYFGGGWHPVVFDRACRNADKELDKRIEEIQRARLSPNVSPCGYT